MTRAFKSFCKGAKPNFIEIGTSYNHTLARGCVKLVQSFYRGKFKNYFQIFKMSRNFKLKDIEAQISKLEEKLKKQEKANNFIKRLATEEWLRQSSDEG